MQQEGLMPDVIAYSALISACEGAQSPKRAFQVFDGMQQQGLMPNVITNNAFITSACEKA